MFKKSLLAVLAAGILTAAASPVQQAYIDSYAFTAVSEMYRSGVPASITLAQGLLESNAGQSELSVKGNNHFGIKCHTGWTGRTMYFDDDSKGECFRVYDDVSQSFVDHSDFLRFRDRYKFLFDYKVTDYKSWARGLSKAGYATDPAYAQKLIKLIEDCSLDRYDLMRPEDFGHGVEAAHLIDNRGKTDEEAAEAVQTALPSSPISLEEESTVMLSSSSPLQENCSFSTSSVLYSRNGVPFIYVREGETLESIADRQNLLQSELRRYNDFPKGVELHPGDIVYLERKKTRAARGLDKYVVESDGECLRDLSCRFAVRLSSLCSMNGMKEDVVLHEGDMIRLR